MSKYIFGYSQRMITAAERSSIETRLKYFSPRLTTRDDLLFTENKLLFLKEKKGNVSYSPTLDLSIFAPGIKITPYRIISIKEINNEIKITSDSIGDRIAWYYRDDNWFFVSNSQFYILRLVGNYQVNEEVWSWMLANGNLNDGDSWDKRIRAIPSGGSVIFSIKKHEVERKQDRWRFEYDIPNREVAMKHLKEKLFDVAAQYELPQESTLLTLSGGLDSRAALFLLRKNHPKLHTATWGTKSSFSQKGTDSFVARKISIIWESCHQEFLFQLSNNFDLILEKFLLLGEGRNDHLNSYMDGLEMWQEIDKMNYSYVIRADEVFGWLPVKTELDARLSVAMGTLSDFSNIPAAVSYDYPINKISESLLKDDSEPIEDYRDRLYQAFRLPFVIGALQDIPLTYVETVNPFLHPEIITLMRKLPPSLRTSKNLYSEWVDTLLPQIPYAYKQAIPRQEELLFQPQNKDFFLSFINDHSASQLIGKSLVTFLRENYPKNEVGHNSTGKLTYNIKKILPVSLKKFIRNKVTGYTLPANALALRALIIFRMQRLIKEIIA